MNITQLYVHDGTLRGVEEDNDNHTLTLLTDLPKDEWSEEYIPKRIVFSDVWNYRIFEGSCDGPITMLDIHIVDGSDGKRKIRLETTSGYREWESSSFKITDE